MLGNLEFTILCAVLQCGRDASGNTIQDEIFNRINREISLGAIYTTLERMERKGFVTSRMSTASASERGGRPKRLFNIEGSGEKAVRDTQVALAAMSHGLDPEWA
jgi:PadR family transcriptional regulator PadR